MSQRRIHIGDVSIPLDSYVVGGTAVLGIRESGKTYLAKGIAEQLLDHSIPIIVFDAIGVWRYLRVAGAGDRAKAFKVVVAGGKEPDLPLTPESAPEIVRAAIRENIPLVIDLYDKKLSKADWRKIVQRCFRTLLYENEGLRHIFLEETAEYAPQKVFDGETYAEVEKLVRMGGNASLGITLINQRSQEVNKAVLDLCENLVLMRQRGAHAIDALQKWMDKIAPEQAKTIAAGMPSMGQGDAWVFAGDAEHPVRTRSKLIRSFHPDRRNPQLMKRAIDAGSTDTSDFVQRMSGELGKLVEQQKANDPGALKKRIADLERQLGGARPAPAPAPAPSAEQLAKAEQRGFDRALKEAARAVEAWRKQLRKEITDLVDYDDLFKDVARPEPIPHVPTSPPSQVERRPPPRHVGQPDSGRATSSSNGSRPPVQQRILDALAELEQMRADHPKRELVAFMAGYSNLTSKGFRNAMSVLSTEGLLTYPQPGIVELNDAGRAAANPSARISTPAELQERVTDLLGGATARILRPLIDAYPNTMERIELAEVAGYGNLTSKGFRNGISRLHSLGFISYPHRGTVKAQPVLFLE